VSWLQAIALVLVGVTGTAVVFTRKPTDQVIGYAFYGFLLGLLFVLFQAPDAALSQLAVGAVVVPMMLLVALARVKGAPQ
jgi:uncharacterized MnhB-related membrane protein